MTTVRERWDTLPAWVRGLAVVAALLTAFNVLAQLLDASIGGGSPGGERSSSYATAPDGLAAYAELLADYDHPVEQQRGELVDADFDRDATLLLVDPGALGSPELSHLLEFASGGGRLVVGGDGVESFGQLPGLDLAFATGGPRTYDEIAPSLAPIGRVRAVRGTHLARLGPFEPLVARGPAVLAASLAVGDGTVVLLADPSPLQNDRLAEVDNAAFAVALAGEDGRRAVFAEGVHGYGTTTGLAALPERWKASLVVLAAAALLGLVAWGRRLGPPEDEERPLPPPRSEYVEALASSLARSGTTAERVRGIQAAARQRIAARAGLPPDAGDAEVAHAAAAAGLPDDEVRAVLAPVDDDAGVLAAGRALARLSTAHGNEGWR